MSEHPIEVLMETAMDSINEMVDVDTIVGEPIETKNGMVIIPISKVCFGFAAGGSEFKGETIDEYKKKEKEEEVQYRLPFGGGSSAGISINPVAFVIIQSDTIKILPIEHTSAIDKIIDYVPDLMEKANKIVDKVVVTEKTKRKDSNNEENIIVDDVIKKDVTVNEKNDLEDKVQERKEKMKITKINKKNKPHSKDSKNKDELR